MNINEFSEEFKQEVLSRCNDVESEHFREDKFTEVMIEYLDEANEIDEGEVCYHKNKVRAEKMNGFSLSGDSECLDLYVSFYHGIVPPLSVPNSEVDKYFGWLRNFFEASLKGNYRDMEEASQVYDVAQQIYAQRDEISKARFFFLTDGVARMGKLKTKSNEGVEIEYHIWDIEKIRRFVASGLKRETIEIDFVKQFGGVVPCIESSSKNGEYRTFLTFFSGTLLANLYGQYGPRLLEKNVRSYLQAKGKVNKGIRTTITEEPQRFLAYNNGISATAEVVELDQKIKGFPQLKKVTDFQIVNGGQTTASIFNALKREKANLDNLMVQVKLTVLNDPKDIATFVPLISQYANSQNKVNAADFSANHPFHIKLEELSRSLWAPSATGTERQTHWYYERARGSYLDDKSREGTPAKIKGFETINPLKQKFTKTDLAKFENTWDQRPHFVCLGAEKNFIKYISILAENKYPTVDEDYFHRLVAKAILFKTAEKIVGAQNYGGYRANVVTYTIAWISHHTAQCINLDEIWKNQKLSNALCDLITKVSVYANEHIVNPPANRRNSGEWSKREECWGEFRKKTIEISNTFKGELVKTNLQQTGGRPSITTTTMDQTAKEEIGRIMNVPAETWLMISKWSKQTNNLLPWQRSLSFSLGRLIGVGGTPSPKQATQGLKLLDESIRCGFKNDLL